MYAPNVKEMTREEGRIAALQQQRILYWRALERERRIAREAPVRATSVRARRRQRRLASWPAEPC
jgi:hypothetical protein